MACFTSRIVSMVSVVVLFSACSESSKTTPSPRKSSSPGPQNQSSDQNGANGGPASTSSQSLDCESQWALALKQQPVGSNFGYGTTISSSFFSQQATRTVVINSASAAAISQTISLSNFPIKLQPQSVTLQKENFIKACQTQVPQPIVIGALGGQLLVTGRSKSEINLQGKSIPVECVDMDIKNVSYGGYQLSAKVQVYLSDKYPALPLRQVLTVTDSPSLQLLVGAVITDVLSSALPASN